MMEELFPKSVVNLPITILISIIIDRTTDNKYYFFVQMQNINVKYIFIFYTIRYMMILRHKKYFNIKKIIQVKYFKRNLYLLLDNPSSNPRRTLKGAATLRMTVKLRGFRKRASFLLPEYFVVAKCILPRPIRKQFYLLRTLLIFQWDFVRTKSLEQASTHLLYQIR